MARHRKTFTLFIAFASTLCASIASATTYGQHPFKAKVVSLGEAPDGATPDKLSFPREIIILVDGYCARDKAISKLERSARNANAIIMSSEKGYVIQLLDETENQYWIAAVSAMNECYAINHALAHRGITGWTNIKVILS